MTNIPKLRFKGFEGEWKEENIADIFDRILTKNKENNKNVLTISAQYGLINQEEFFTKSVSSKNLENYFLLHKNDFAYNKSYSKGYPIGAIKKLTRYDKGVVSPLYICFKTKKNDSSDYLEKYFDSGKHNHSVWKIVQEGARNHGLLNMSTDDFFKLVKVFIPKFEEQEKIAEFLKKVDEWFGNLKKQKENLEKYKKGMMQKIFAQKIKFRDENGKDFSEWKNEKLAEVIYEVKKEKEENPQKLQLLTVKLHNNGITASGKFPSVTEKGRPYYKRYIGELLIGRQNFHNGGFGLVYEETNGLIASNAISSFLFNEYIHPKFIYYLISRESFYKRIANLIGGTGQKEISCNEIMKIKIQLPEFEEQQKITEFLTSIDKLIDLKQEQIAKAEEWKKGLIQGLFV